MAEGLLATAPHELTQPSWREVPWEMDPTERPQLGMPAVILQITGRHRF